MAVAFADLVAELQTKIPPVTGVLDDAQYEQAVKEAVGDYSSRNPLRKKTIIEVVSGTDTYTLPDDFYKVEELEILGTPGGVGFSSSGKLIPLSNMFEEHYYINGLSIIFDPEPAYNANRELWYMARYIQDGDAVYQDMTDEVGRVVLLKAQALALEVVANDEAGNSLSYRDGDVSVDLSKKSSTYQKRIDKFNDQYEDAVDRHIGAVLVRGEGWRVEF